MNSVWKQSMISKYGSEEAYKQHFRDIAKKGGEKKVPKGFGSDVLGEDGITGKERAIWAGKKGKKTTPKKK